jgi:acetyl-CoA carboxylase carboxyltransferase component
MRRSDEEEEFSMATKGLKSNKSASALRAVSRLSALKGVHFIELCSQLKIPLLFLQNITGKIE